MSSFSFEYFEDAELPALFAALKRTFDAANVPFYLIGARARDVWFLPQKNMRITKDIDWIAASEEAAIFKIIIHQLIEKEHFTPTRNPFTLISPKGMEVDLLPFSENTGRSLEGLREVFERGTQGVTFDGGVLYQVATLPAIVLLKLIAWDDRPDYRVKDLQDIGVILAHYFERFADDIYDNHNDLFENRELNEIAAHVIGRKIRYIIGKSTQLQTRLTDILKNKRKKIVITIAQASGEPENTINQVLNSLLEGISEA